MQISTDKILNRRSFLAGSAAAIGATAVGSTALSYSRIRGANRRISLGHIGIGRRGRELAEMAAGLKDEHGVERTAVCALGKINREQAEKTATDVYARAP